MRESEEWVRHASFAGDGFLYPLANEEDSTRLLHLAVGWVWATKWLSWGVLQPEQSKAKNRSQSMTEIGAIPASDVLPQL